MSQLAPDIPCSSLTPKPRTLLTEKTDRLLLRIVRANFNAQYASQAPSLAVFRVVAAHEIEVDGTLLQDFRNHVALMDYASYKPFVAKFNEQPCKESEVENLFAPGLPFSLVWSSTTSGNAPKIDVKGPEDLVVYCGYKELKEVERDSGLSTWDITFHVAVPGQAAPWAASLITHHRFFLTIHALFCLVSRDLDRLIMTFAPVFMDLLRHVDEEWDMVLTCIKDGTIPDLEGIDHVRAHLQVQLHANPGRATELREIGSPFSCAGWAARVWPKMRMLVATCSGPFAFVLPKVRFILGPTIAICNPGYGATECSIGACYDMNYLDTFVLHTKDVVELLDAAAEENYENILQPWDLEAGKQYQVVLTTRDGLWRYPLGDIIEIVGFDTNDGSPVFKYSGQKSLSIRFPHALISDSDFVALTVWILACRLFNDSWDWDCTWTTVVYNPLQFKEVPSLLELAGAQLELRNHLEGLWLKDGLFFCRYDDRDLQDYFRTTYSAIVILFGGGYKIEVWYRDPSDLGQGSSDLQHPDLTASSPPRFVSFHFLPGAFLPVKRTTETVPTYFPSTPIDAPTALNERQWRFNIRA
ncbi:hypothetical protein PAXINDRAFT_100830 [Paxillus involutus ATCC 200175]|uniref:GH3 middle domain-containing protein n=1 Tax=Paxillus involutus ATCC 200175 TaxID=664439 RepID=A0A0C9TCG2_PAXIN|nr:hypothetical protein PAXINDRAFT_100830 [Paxillus involutus ATCC 200175]